MAIAAPYSYPLQRNYRIQTAKCKSVAKGGPDRFFLRIIGYKIDRTFRISLPKSNRRGYDPGSERHDHRKQFHRASTTHDVPMRRLGGGQG